MTQRTAGRRRSAQPRAGAAQAGAAHRRSQRLSVGAARERRARSRQARHHEARADDHDRHPAAAGGRRRRAVLVRVRAGGCRAGTGHGDARADRRRPPDDAQVPGDVRAGADRRRRRADLQEGQDRVAHRHGGRTLDRQLARRAAHVPPAGRALHDAHALEEHPLGRLGHRYAGAQRPLAVRRAGRARDELARDARRSVARVARHDEGRDRASAKRR